MPSPSRSPTIARCSSASSSLDSCATASRSISRSLDDSWGSNNSSVPHADAITSAMALAVTNLMGPPLYALERPTPQKTAHRELRVHDDRRGDPRRTVAELAGDV